VGPDAQEPRAETAKLGEGRKVNELTGEVESNDPRDDITDIVREYGNFQEGPTVKILDNDDFGYTRVTWSVRSGFDIKCHGRQREVP